MRAYRFQVGLMLLGLFLFALLVACGGSGSNSSSTSAGSGSAGSGASSGGSGGSGSGSGSGGSGGSSGGSGSGGGSGTGHAALFVGNTGSQTQQGGNIAAFSASNGTLTSAPGSPYPAGDGPASTAVSESAKLLFVAEDLSTPGVRGSNCNSFPGVLLTERYDATTGALTQLSRTTLNVSCPAIIVDPQGKDLYITGSTVSNSSGVIEGFAIQSDGTLKPIAGSPFAVTQPVVGMAITPSGSTMYASTGSAPGSTLNGAPTAGIFVFARDTNTGVITLRNQVAANGQGQLAVSPTGNALVATSIVNTGSQVLSYSIASSGDLTQVSSIAEPLAISVAFHPSGKFVAVGIGPGNNTSVASAPEIAVFNVGAGGDLTQVNGSPFATGSWPGSLAYDPSGNWLYVTDRSNFAILTYAVDASGALKKTGSVASQGDYPSALSVAKLQ